MQSETEKQSWRVHVTAKANNFNFRLRFASATFNKPSWNWNWNFSFFRLSILLNLPNFAFKFSSKPTHERPLFAAKFMKFLHKLRPRLPKKKESNNLPYLKDPIRIGFWVMGFVACVAQFMYKSAQREIVMLASLGSLLFLLRKLKIAKVMNLVRFFFVVVGTIFCYLFFNFDYNNYYNNNYWEYFGRSWNKMVNL